MAFHILVMRENAALAAGKSTDVAHLEELERSLRETVRLMRQLSIASKRKINYLSPQLPHERKMAPGLILQVASTTSGNRAFQLRLEALESLIIGVQTLRQVPAFKSPSSIKRNYEAAAVAAACLKVWREELRTRKKGRKEPPKTVNAYYPGPMGRFIQDVFEVLSIGATPASAMANLKDLGGEEALLLSLEEG